MEQLTTHLSSLLSGALERLGLSAEGLSFEFPADTRHGDIATTIALSAAKRAGKAPREIAEALVADITPNLGEHFSAVSIAGPGFINFTIALEFFAHTIRDIVNSAQTYGMSSAQAGKRVLVEYTDPNAFKEFHIGHLMSNTIGEALARLIEQTGAEVKRLCYQSDIGLNVAKAVWGMQQSLGSLPPESDTLANRIQFVGNAYVLGSRQYEDDLESKKEIDALNKVIFEQSNPRVQELYEKGRAWSLEHFEEIYAKLGTTFDHNYFESAMAAPGLAIVKDFLSKGVFEESDGAIVYKGEQDGLHTRVFVNKFGLPTYEAKELALASDKVVRFPHNTSIVITANEQDAYFKVVLSALSKIDASIAQKIKHVSHGMMRFAEGKMSSRKGNIVTGESLIESVISWVQERMSARAVEGTQIASERAEIEDAVAISAIKYSILRQSPGKDIIFDPESSLSFEGDSGPYLLYSLSRANSVLRKAEEAGIVWGAVTASEVTPIDRVLYRFPHVVKRAALELSPQLVVTFLTELAGAFNSWYAAEKIIGGGEHEARRVALVQAFSIVMRNGISMLGMKPLNRM